MTTAVTRRVSGAIAADATKRVTGVSGAIYEAWGGSWGASWGNTWLVFLGLSAIGHTARVSATPSVNTIGRVNGV